MPATGKTVEFKTGAARWGGWTAAVFLAALVLYIATAVPDFTFDDNPEFIAGSYVLGVVHAPGYPLVLLLGKLFSFLAPGTAGFAVNLVSAFAGAGAVALAFLLLARATGWWAPSLLGAGMLATSRLFWEQTTSMEVYALNLFFLMLSLNIIWTIDGSRRDLRRLIALAFVVATGIFNHYTMALISPVYAVYIIWIYRKKLAALFLPAAIAVFVGLVCFSVMFYLPARSAAVPAINWDDQVTAQGFIKHVKGVDRRTGAPVVAFSEKLTFVKDYGWRLSRERTPWLLLLLPFGLFAVLKLKGRGALLGVLWVTLFAGFILLLNFLYGPRSSYVIKVFHISSMGLVAVVLGLGADVVMKWVRGLKLPWQAVFGIIAALVAYSAVMNTDTTDKSENNLAPAYARNMLKFMDRDSVLFSSLETESFPVSNMRLVNGFRRDIGIMGRQGDLRETVFAMNRLGFQVSDMGSVEDLQSFVLEHTSRQREIYFTKRLSIRAPEKITARVNGLLYQLDPLIEKIWKRDPWDRIDMTGIDPDKQSYDRIEKTVVSKYLVMHGEHYIEKGEWEKGREYLKRAEEFNPESRFLRTQLGAIFLAVGDFEAAREQYETALAIDPENVEISVDTVAVYSNLSFIYGKLGLKDTALSFMEEAVKLSPDLSVFRVNLGKTYWHNERWNDAIEQLEAAVRLGIKNAAVHNILGICYEKIGLFSKAEENYERALDLNPMLPDAYLDYGIYSAYVKGDAELAVSLLTTYLELRHKTLDEGEIRATVAFLNQQLKRHDEAIIEFRKALDEGAGETPRKKAILYNRLADSLEAKELPDEAVDAYESGLSGAAYYPEIYRNYAEFLFRNERDPALTLKLLDRYLAAVKDPDDRVRVETLKTQVRARMAGGGQ